MVQDRSPVRIAVLGADGRMGRALVRAVLAAAARGKLSAAVERPGHPAVGKTRRSAPASKAPP